MATANPVFTAVAAGAWVKVATNVTSVNLSPVLEAPAQYAWTYVLTGGAAPTEDPLVKLMPPTENFCWEDAVDVYVYCTGAAGNVRVDEGAQAAYLIDA